MLLCATPVSIIPTLKQTTMATHSTTLGTIVMAPTVLLTDSKHCLQWPYTTRVINWIVTSGEMVKHKSLLVEISVMQRHNAGSSG